MKEGTVLKSAVPDQEEMGEINRYTRREYGPQEVYAFSLALCDNEIDRDFERFSVEALETLGELFLGKTCIFDHEQKSVNQTARIYRTALRREPGRKTRAGEEYVQLTARAYLPKTQGNGEVIELIESGILKEVSVSCSVKRKVCGLCGREHCGHEKGKEYPEGLGHLVLLEPTDAYECSFVAVPAQRAAGVVKHYEGGMDMDIEKRLEEAPEEGVLLTKSQAGELLAQVKAWKEEAQWGRSYRERLQGDVLKYSAVLQPELPRAVMEAVVKALALPELSQMAETYEKLAGQKLPLKPQLAPEAQGVREASNGEFCI